jgi:lipopolysaccharide/colanic/teichoic acid biosynthesis glycosyltransferase
MTEWKRAEVDYKIAPEDSLSIIGSNSIHTKGDLYTVNINAIDTTVNRRNKRLLDFVMSGILFILSPVLIFLIRKPAGFLKNSLLILFGKKSLVGYYPLDESLQHLPKIKKGVLNPVDGMRTAVHEDETILNLNILYARDYNVWKDMNIILYAFRDLGK